MRIYAGSVVAKPPVLYSSDEGERVTAIAARYWFALPEEISSATTHGGSDLNDRDLIGPWSGDAHLSASDATYISCFGGYGNLGITRPAQVIAAVYQALR